MNLRNRLILIIKAENLTINNFSKICKIPLKTMFKLKNRIIDTLPDNELIKITNNPRFNKYTLWMMLNKTATSSGQIDPALFPVCA